MPTLEPTGVTSSRRITSTMLPFFKNSSNAVLKAVLGGWQIAGITSISSGQPVPRISELHQQLPPRWTAEHRRRSWAGDQTANLYWFNPNAYAPAADGTYGNSVRIRMAPARTQPDRPVPVEELDVERFAAHPVPRRRDQRLQPHAVGCGPERDRPRQHVHDQPDHMQPVERHVRPDHRDSRAARDTAWAEVLLVRETAMKRLLLSMTFAALGATVLARGRRSTRPIPTKDGRPAARCRLGGGHAWTTAAQGSPA